MGEIGWVGEGETVMVHGEGSRIKQWKQENCACEATMKLLDKEKENDVLSVCVFCPAV